MKHLKLLKRSVAALSKTHAVPPAVVLYLLYGFNGDFVQADAYLSGNSIKTPWSYHEDRVLKMRLRHKDLTYPSLLSEQRSPEEMTERAKFLSLPVYATRKMI